MNPDDLDTLLEKRRKDENRRQTKRALIGTFVIIPLVVVTFLIAWRYLG